MQNMKSLQKELYEEKFDTQFFTAILHPISPL